MVHWRNGSLFLFQRFVSPTLAAAAAAAAEVEHSVGRPVKEGEGVVGIE